MKHEQRDISVCNRKKCCCRLIEQLKSLVKSKDLIIEEQDKLQGSRTEPLERQITKLQDEVKKKDKEIQVQISNAFLVMSRPLECLCTWRGHCMLGNCDTTVHLYGPQGIHWHTHLYLHIQKAFFFGVFSKENGHIHLLFHALF